MGTHYVEIGDCAVITYYVPISLKDRLIFVLLGVIFAGVTGYISLMLTQKYRVVVMGLLLYIASTIILCCFGNDILGSRTEYWPHEYKVNPYSTSNGHKLNTDTISIEKSFWNLPMDGSIWDKIAMDSVKYLWEHDTTDFGIRLPIDEYEMCTKRYGTEPQSNICLDMIEGTWYGYGHMYDPIHILTLTGDYKYSLFSKEISQADGKEYSTLISSGNYIYNKERNEITFQNFYDEIVRGDYIKTRNPRNKTSIVYSLKKDTMVLYENTGDCYYYYRNQL